MSQIEESVITLERLRTDKEAQAFIKKMNDFFLPKKVEDSTTPHIGISDTHKE